MLSIHPSVAARYTEYWRGLQPEDDVSLFRLWLFAFLSVHTTWTNNVNGYTALHDLAWRDNKALLADRLHRSGVGFHNNRTRYIWQFSKVFWSSPDRYRKRKNESWRRLRDRLARDTLGLGLAKTTFALELSYPEAPLCCLDRHILRFMVGDLSLNGNMSPEQYAKLEARWVRAARKVDVPPAMARHIYWDQLQGQNDTRYWSSCLEAA